jgi:electron transport complex protein RnfG
MSETQPLPAGLPNAWPMYRSLVGVGLMCGLLIVSVFLWTRPVIERNRAEALRRAIFRVLPEARSSATFLLTAEDRFERLDGAAPGAPRVHAGYDAEGRLVGLALEAEGMGYQDVIHVLYGYSFDEDAIIGIRVLESRETPGLGDKIETDAAFLENFVRLDVSLTEDMLEILHPIEFAKHGTKQHPWQVDGITGATISSKAIASILNHSASWWTPRIRRRLDDFRVSE